MKLLKSPSPSMTPSIGVAVVHLRSYRCTLSAVHVPNASQCYGELRYSYLGSRSADQVLRVKGMLTLCYFILRAYLCHFQFGRAALNHTLCLKTGVSFITTTLSENFHRACYASACSFNMNKLQVVESLLRNYVPTSRTGAWSETLVTSRPHTAGGFDSRVGNRALFLNSTFSTRKGSCG